MDDNQQLENPTPPSSSSSSSSSSVITPLLISAAGITGTFLIIFTYHLLITRCFSRRRPADASAAAGGVGEKVLRGIPAVVYSEGDNGGLLTPLDGKVNDCVICIGELTEGETVRFMPGCGHVFHASCVDGWLMRNCSCPTCRAPIGFGCDDVASAC
ncbi:RING-H2 finger protein ATL8 [Linum perenne]